MAPTHEIDQELKRLNEAYEPIFPNQKTKTMAISLLVIKKLELSIAKDEFKRFPHAYQAGKVEKAQAEVNKLTKELKN